MYSRHGCVFIVLTLILITNTCHTICGFSIQSSTHIYNIYKVDGLISVLVYVVVCKVIKYLLYTTHFYLQTFLFLVLYICLKKSFIYYMWDKNKRLVDVIYFLTRVFAENIYVIYWLVWDKNKFIYNCFVIVWTTIWGTKNDNFHW